jgi:hypothetical protein
MTVSKDFRIKRNIIITILWIATLSCGIYLAYDNSIQNVGFAPLQPMSFSHRTHSEKFGIRCLYCHYSAERSEYSAIPSSRQCMICHLGLKTKQEQLIPLIMSYDSLKPLTWKGIYRLPDYTRFSHSRHIITQIDCSSCHGEVETMDSVWQVRPLTMKWCLDCHRNPSLFIVPPRTISGIFTDMDIYNNNQLLITNHKLLIEESRPETKPEYGLWPHKFNEPLITNIPMPQQPGRGPETCSSCHY